VFIDRVLFHRARLSCLPSVATPCVPGRGGAQRRGAHPVASHLVLRRRSKQLAEPSFGLTFPDKFGHVGLGVAVVLVPFVLQAVPLVNLLRMRVIANGRALSFFQDMVKSAVLKTKGSWPWTTFAASVDLRSPSPDDRSLPFPDHDLSLLPDRLDGRPLLVRQLVIAGELHRQRV
jgi:hypothetical protein